MLIDFKSGRDRVRQNMDREAVTAGYPADRNGVIKLLNEALASELVCVLRYERHHFMACGLKAKHAAREFLEHANEGRAHALLIASRIVQIGGEPEFSPEATVNPFQSEDVEGLPLMEMIQENLAAEKMTIANYREIITYLGDQDTTTLRMIEGILETEEEHADDLSRLARELCP
jgi:bacterioferritin